MFWTQHDGVTMPVSWATETAETGRAGGTEERKYQGPCFGKSSGPPTNTYRVPPSLPPALNRGAEQSGSHAPDLPEAGS